MCAYESRLVLFRSRIKVADIELKVYEMFAENRCEDARPEPATIVKYLHSTSDLFSSTMEQHGHDVGFVILHYAADGDYVLASRWCGNNMLRHQVFALSWGGSPGAIQLTPLTVHDIIACVWELEVIKFERDQWIKTAMNDPSGSPGAEMLNRYLNATFSGYV